MSSSLIALLDCNNFYASCERVFDPALRNKPVIVLSNNDGCVIARSNEAKKLGIPMGAPVFQYRDVIHAHKVIMRSSNFTLYGDMSNRVMKTIYVFCDNIEIYSIDEAFISLEGYDTATAVERMKALKKTIEQWTGIPVSVGISQTKTLAKIASHKAKKDPDTGGVCLLDAEDKEKLKSLLAELPVKEVWGIGYRTTRFLENRYIRTALDLVEKPDEWIRKNMTIAGLKTVWELRGKACLSSHNEDTHKSILCSRSFSKAIMNKAELFSALAQYLARACEKLRDQHSVAHTATIFIASSRFLDAQERYSNSYTISLSGGSNAPPDFLLPMREALDQIYKSGYGYKRAGVVLSGMVPEKGRQMSLVDNAVALEKKREVLASYDRINRKFGRGTLQFASLLGKNKLTHRDPEYTSPRYTTKLEEVLKVR